MTDFVNKQIQTKIYKLKHIFYTNMLKCTLQACTSSEIECLKLSSITVLNIFSVKYFDSNWIIANAKTGYRVHFRILSAIRKLLWKHPRTPNFKTKTGKIADSRFAISNQSYVEQLKKNFKKPTQTWLKVWQTWATEQKFDQKIEDWVRGRRAQ